MPILLSFGLNVLLSKTKVIVIGSSRMMLKMLVLGGQAAIVELAVVSSKTAGTGI